MLKKILIIFMVCCCGSCMADEAPVQETAENSIPEKIIKQVLLNITEIDNLNEIYCDLSFDNGTTLEKIEVAANNSAREKGLMNRNAAGSGMLFVWWDESERSFWMRNTKIPLSIGFFHSNGTLFDIQDMQPYSEELHHSSGKAQYALELAKGEFLKYSLDLGSKIIKTNCYNLL